MGRFIFYLIVIIALIYGGAALYYGSPDPCEMLASQTGIPAVGEQGVVSCSVELVQSWFN
jgi:fructose 1,6-bisphosphatase